MTVRRGFVARRQFIGSLRLATPHAIRRADSGCVQIQVRRFRGSGMQAADHASRVLRRRPLHFPETDATAPDHACWLSLADLSDRSEMLEVSHPSRADNTILTRTLALSEVS